MLAVQVERHRLGLHAEGDLVPVAVKQVVDAVVLEHGPHGVLRQTHGVVLHRFVLSVQTDGHLSSRGEEVPSTRGLIFTLKFDLVHSQHVNIKTKLFFKGMQVNHIKLSF